MNREMLYSKIHRATVTEANLHYTGSITIDKSIMERAGLLAGQKVDIANINNGDRFSTYVIEGARDSGVVCLNGAAARNVQVGDKIIIMAYGIFTAHELESYAPIVILLDDNNHIIPKER